MKYKNAQPTGNWDKLNTLYLINQEQRNQDKVEKAILETHAGK